MTHEYMQPNTHLKNLKGFDPAVLGCHPYSIHTRSDGKRERKSPSQYSDPCRARLSFCLLCFPGESSLSPGLQVSLCKPLTSLHQLPNIDKLLSSHNRSTDTCDNPGPEGVHLVSSGILQRTRAPRIGEKAAGRDMRGTPRLESASCPNICLQE